MVVATDSSACLSTFDLVFLIPYGRLVKNITYCTSHLRSHTS